MSLALSGTAWSATSALASDPYWHLLLRDDKPQDGRYRSDVTETGFFLSDRGREDAQAELDATLAAFRGEDAGDASPACRFPARRAWLARHAPDASQWPAQSCPALQRWLDGIAPEQATLVFASDYSGNPSSLFGHTFLRIDARGQRADQRLLSYAINYQAETDRSASVLFALRGLSGGYRASFSLLPYYDKVKEYVHLESRDLWEYELTLPPEAVERLLLTYWEWRQVKAPYFFLSRNCSYELLGLLEAATPGTWLRERFPAQAIPADTLKAVTRQPGMVKRIVWRPARDTRLDAQTRQLTLPARAAATTLLDGAQVAETEALSPTDRAQALEAAHDELHARLLDGLIDPSVAGPRLRHLLLARASIPVGDQRPVPAQPAADPTQGHDPMRAGLGMMAGGDRPALLLSFRPAYHDALDPAGGYRPGTRLDVLSGTLRLDARGRADLEEASLFALESLTPGSPFRDPLSWSLRLGADRRLGDQGAPGTLAVAEGSLGRAFTVNGPVLCHLQTLVDVRGGRVLDRGWETGIGARAGCSGGMGAATGAPLRWLLEARPVYRFPVGEMAWQAMAGLQMSLARDQALRLELRQEWREASLGVASLQWLRYF